MEQPTNEVPYGGDELEQGITSAIGELLELRMEEASVSESVDSGAFAFRTSTGTGALPTHEYLVDTMDVGISMDLER